MEYFKSNVETSSESGEDDIIDGNGQNKYEYKEAMKKKRVHPTPENKLDELTKMNIWKIPLLNMKTNLHRKLRDKIQTKKSRHSHSC